METYLVEVGIHAKHRLYEDGDYPVFVQAKDEESAKAAALKHVEGFLNQRCYRLGDAVICAGRPVEGEDVIKASDYIEEDEE